VRWEAGLSLGLIVATFVGAPTLAWASGKLREHHRWAVQICHVDGQARACSWRRTGPRDDDTPGVRGVWNGVGLAIPVAAPDRRSRWPLKRSWTWLRRLRHRGVARLAPLDALTTISAGEFSVQVGAESNATVSLASVAQATRESSPLPLRIEAHHSGGKLLVRVRISIPPGQPSAALPGRLWVNEIAVALLPH